MGKWVVTGGAGFIGSNLVEKLLEMGKDVRVVDSYITGKKENLTEFMDSIELVEGDLRDKSVCEKAAKDAEVIFHQAALGSVPRSVADPLTTHDYNVNATVNLLLEAREAGVRRFVVASSSSIYGANPTLPKHEDLAVQPISPYAVSKLAQEKYALAFGAVYGMESVALRYFNIYGPRQDPQSQYAAVIPLFVKAALTKSSPTIHGDGEQTRDFTFVGDCVAANIKAATEKDCLGHALNIAGGGETSINQLWEKIKSIIGAEVDAVHTDPRPGDVKKSRADNSLARKTMGWDTKVGLDEGLEKTVLWMKKSNSL